MTNQARNEILIRRTGENSKVFRDMGPNRGYAWSMGNILVLIAAATAAMTLLALALWVAIRRQLRQLRRDLLATQQLLEIEQKLRNDEPPPEPPRHLRIVRAILLFPLFATALQWVRSQPGPAGALAATAATIGALVPSGGPTTASPPAPGPEQAAPVNPGDQPPTPAPPPPPAPPTVPVAIPEDVTVRADEPQVVLPPAPPVAPDWPTPPVEPPITPPAPPTDDEEPDPDDNAEPRDGPLCVRLDVGALTTIRLLCTPGNLSVAR